MQDPNKITTFFVNYGLQIIIVLFLFFKIILPILKLVTAVITTALSIVHSTLKVVLGKIQKIENNKPYPKPEEEPGVMIID